MCTAALVPAAGRGERLGPGAPKALREVAGEPLLVHAVRALWRSAVVDLVVVAAPADTPTVGCAAVEQTLTAAVAGLRVRVVPGGATRRQSVAAALSELVACAPDTETVLVHDAARAFVPVEVVERVVEAVRAGAPAVVPGVPLPDTVKRVEGAVVRATVDRSTLRAVQTPQGFARDVLVRAHAQHATAGTPEATDDAGLVEALGLPVRMVAGSDEAFKVTRPLDLVLAEALLRRRR